MFAHVPAPDAWHPHQSPQGRYLLLHTARIHGSVHLHTERAQSIVTPP